MRASDLAGHRYGRLTVIRRNGVAKTGKKPALLWLCRCDCGVELSVRSGNLRTGNTTSCGCQRSEHAQAASHRRTNTSAYWRWKAMIQRCTNPRNRAWKDYGGRGIVVCERWRSFESFYADMGDPPAGVTLDRIDVDGDYEPGNCRWATISRQSRNKRGTRIVSIRGRSQSLADWADEYGVDYQLVFYRIQRGWDVERALTAPSGARR